jgi:hypothetical protein
MLLLTKDDYFILGMQSVDRKCQEDYEEDTRSQTQVISTPTRQVEKSMLIISTLTLHPH